MESTIEGTTEKVEKSYLSAAVDSISPWSNPRSSILKPNSHGDRSGLRNQNGGDRITQKCHGPSLKRYPIDCPPLCPRWFHAVDIPKRKPKLLNTKPQTEPKPTPVAKKFVVFSEHDSRAIEIAYQQLINECYDSKNESPSLNNSNQSSIGSRKSNTNLNEAASEENARGKIRIPVQEDYLFDVDVEKREISPVYWLGPIYEVRRGSWFYQEGTTLRPCEENLAAQLEEGYLKIKPFRYPKVSDNQSSSRAQVKLGDVHNSTQSAPAKSNRPLSSEVRPQLFVEDLDSPKHNPEEKVVASPKEASASFIHQPQTCRLFGTYMNSVVTYQDSNVAWLSADGLISRVSSTVYQKFAGGGYLGGVKLVRGYIEPNKAKESPENKGAPTPSIFAPKNSGFAENISPQLDRSQKDQSKGRYEAPENSGNWNVMNTDLVQSSDLVLTSEKSPRGSRAESIRTQEQNDNQCEYNDEESDSQGRPIDHLILCTHGIGQRLGMRTETVNFVQDINVLRKTLKSVYENSADLQALNSEIDKLPKNCRVQVLPICWRHLLDFPGKGVRQTRREHDLGDAFGDEEEYPSLEDITIEGVPFARSLITDLALDILLFQSAYREHICNIVLAESNRIYRLFRERNPEFKGKVSLLGHSLGSAILFDLLSRQKEHNNNQGQRLRQHNQDLTSGNYLSRDLEFEFEVEDFYCYGSPIGLFQMLKGRNILARNPKKEFNNESVSGPENLQDSYFSASSSSNISSPQNISSVTGLPPTVSSPKVGRLYNIFHPSDPIAYRLEPLISPVMSSMKPQSLPYTKRTITSSMSGIGAKVGQSVSGIWTSLSSGLASSLFNRSLGLTNGDIARMEASSPSKHSFQSMGPNKGGVATIDGSTFKREEASMKKRQSPENTAILDPDSIGGPISTSSADENIETLYSGFQKAHRIDHGTIEEKWKRIKREEAKIRALNSNGRVDYSIQETFLDLNPMNTIASHMSYWADEDVSHFMMSQLLSRNCEPIKHEKSVTEEKEL
ncbi:putative phospholipase C20G8.02, mitochondrial [Golovinomyces cichoracearum]|uniref:Putative phospholipase C20G8.02, mitochondrial n=1 Tax=Golovinomyces cichoracearum TaxID=62708 RepID=A0A420HM64_9PEZI|nr:putative phospholipase C20G8.02, mitochondrial [Golovinomyces cichoracearum]